MSVHAPHALPTVAATEAAVAGGGFFPVRRIYCVGRNYLDHIREMKEADERDPPFFFQKPRDAIVLDGARIPYPPFTSDFQFEVELVVALGKGGRDIAVEAANGLIWGYAVGIDLTRRDRQRDARDMRLPWEVGKSFDASAPCGPIAQVRDPAHFEHCAITLAVNGVERQRGDIGQMIWNVPEVIAQLSKQVTLGSRRPDLYRYALGRRSRRAGRSDHGPYRRTAVAHHHHYATRGLNMLPTERISYSPISERPALKLPDGKRMAVWVIVNVEEWDANQPMPRTVLTPPAGGSPSPDIPNWAWHEYGNRVGFWRLLKIFDDFKIPAALAINGSALAAYPAIVNAAKERHWEFMGHGFTQRNMQKVENEREDIRKTADVIAKATGKRPRGWLGPGLTETWETPDLLKQEGYDYVADWVLDDQPVWLKTTTTPIVNIPYTQECNDVAMMLIQHHKASEYQDRALDQFEQIYEDAANSARVMALVIHPYIMGAAHRTKYFRRIFETIRQKPDVAFMTGEQILDWYLKTGPKAP